MTASLGTLLKNAKVDHLVHRPRLFRPHRAEDRSALSDLLASQPGIQVFDAIEGQLTELVKTMNPARRFTEDELKEAAMDHLNGTPAGEYGVWVYYPWSFRLVHLLDEAEFVQVRTDRNRNKITREEQALLATKKVGVIGLSVGQSVSLTMALERGFGEIRLADFDTLELSNLNRIRSGVHRLGVNKAVNAAREIAEIDPFLKVTCFTQGITRDGLDAFFLDNGKLDVLVEECDSVDIKILARQKARELGVPVVMDMSDRGCIDVERFDLEPERPIMHGWIDHLDLEAAARPMTNEEKVPYMLPIVGTDTLSVRMKASMIELGETIGTWPQLATSVVLGGALTGDVCRRIFLGEFTKSGRWYVDLEELIADDKQEEVPSLTGERIQPENNGHWGSIASRIDADAPAVQLTEEQVHRIAQAGALAPSAGNMQPWRFHYQQGRLFLFHDKARSESRWDPDHLIAHIALGTCLENMLIRAAAIGVPMAAALFPLSDTPELVAMLEPTAGSNGSGITSEVLALDPMIGERCTNRKNTRREPLEQSHIEAIRQVASSVAGCSLSLFDTEEQLNELAAICGGAERIRVMDPVGHHEFFAKELRWTAREAEESGDGLDIATMELSPGQEAALKIAADPRAVSLASAWHGGRSFERFSRSGIRTASAVALVRVEDKDLSARLEGGRSAQRVWMKANQLGLSVHPISAPIFLFHARRSMPDLGKEQADELAALEERFMRLCGGDSPRPLFMMRLVVGGSPSVRSLRLPIEKMLTLGSSFNP